MFRGYLYDMELTVIIGNARGHQKYLRAFSYFILFSGVYRISSVPEHPCYPGLYFAEHHHPVLKGDDVYLADPGYVVPGDYFIAPGLQYGACQFLAFYPQMFSFQNTPPYPQITCKSTVFVI